MILFMFALLVRLRHTHLQGS